MKNIYWVSSEKRYLGVKQIKKHKFIAHGKTQLECKNNLSAMIKEFFSNTIQSPKKNITLGEFWEKWFNQDKKPHISQGTIDDIEKCKRQLEPILQLSIGKLNKDNILAFFDKIKTSRMKEKMNLYLKACLKSAVNNGVIKKNPYDVIILSPNRRNPKQPLKYNEQVQFLEAVKNKPIGIIAMIYLLTGLRKSELNFKSIENDINFENKILKAINLKGRHQVKRYKYIRLEQGTINLIMNNIDIIHQYDEEKAYREIFEILRSLGIKKSIVNLRHTFATNHLYLGTPDYVISKEMGHSTSQITKDNYMDIDFDLSKEKIVKLYNNLYPIFL